MISNIIPPGIQKPWIILSGSSFGIVLLSFMRFSYTGVLTVDFIKFHGWASYAAGLGFISLLCIFGYGYYRVVLNYEGWTMNRHEVTVLSLWMALMTTPMLPMLSNDIFSYLAYGDLVLKGFSPYDSGYNLLQSDFFDYLAPWFNNWPCVYGPVALGISVASVSIGGTHNLLGPIMAFKVLNAVFIIVFITVISRLEGKGDERFNTHALVLLSPLLWLQGSGQGHFDMIAVTFIAAAIMCALKDRYSLAAVLAAMAFNVKITGAIICPLLLFMLWDSYKQRPLQFAGNALKCIGIFIAVTVFVWLPFYDGPQSITEPLAHILSKSEPAIQQGIKIPVKLILKAYNSITGSVTRADKKAFLDSYAFIMNKALIALFFIIVFFTIKEFFKRTSSGQAYITLFAILGTALFTIGANAFYPWYMLMILPFYLYLDDRKWVVWLILVSITVHFLDISILLHKSKFASLLNQTSMVIVTALFIWRMPSRYFISPISKAGPCRIRG